MNQTKLYIQRNLEVHLALLGRKNPLCKSHRAFPLDEAKMPLFNLRTMVSREERIAAISNVINWLDVEISHRYTPTQSATFCNIYAYDVAFCLGCYIPRVWWRADLTDRLVAGDKIDVRYGETVFEMNCNNLFYWFEKFGVYFGWVKCNSDHGIQSFVDQGTVAVVIARNRKDHLSGHIAIVIPHEGSNMKSKDHNMLLQSQAGRVNKRNFYDKWWEDNCFAEFSFWVFTRTPEFTDTSLRDGVGTYKS